MDKKSDLRVIKTRKIIFQTLLELMKEKTFEEIALEEGCTYQCVQRSVYRAVAKIKNILKNL